MHKRIILILIFTVISVAARSQQFPIYTQYWTNKFLLNPAVAGHEGYTAVNMTARKQWAGFDGSPRTVAISAQTRLLRRSYMSRGKVIRRKPTRKSRSGRVGYGGYLFNDNVGVFNKTGFQGTYSYHLDIDRSQLSFGVSLTGMQFQLNKDEIITEYDDNLIDITAEKGYFIDGNFGVYYSDKNLYAGFSVQNLSENYLKLNNWADGSGKLRLERQYMFMGGYRIPAYDFIFVEPSFNFKFAENVVSQLDFNATAYFKEDYWGGLAYRTGSTSKIATETLGGKGSSIIVYGGARIEQVYFGYSFDYTLSSIKTRTYGSHEVMIAMRFGDNARRYRWLNRY
ncbi:MAG: type IX secretion system membrane protein PorP/SprF [Bacteroidales bacterium]|nr:type IX secretion system membrane protein PorP/SprF [Bacteroidales bacterium]MBN2818387.1 type IX secretion system membrane protein PorP/SprF [Bacteroidales bacterium]